MAQFRKDTQQFLPQEKTIFEVNMLSTPDGVVVSNTNPLPVTLGGATVEITSNNVSVTVPNTISVNSSTSDPLHVHISEIGTSGNLQFSYMPIGGNVSIFQSNGAAITTSNPLPVTTSGSSVTVGDLNPAYTTVFDEILTQTLIPQVQIDAVYGYKEDQVVLSTTFEANATVSAANSMFYVTNGSTRTSIGQVVSRRYLRYRPGQGLMGRLSALFTCDGSGNGVANITQRVGFSSIGQSYAFGFSGNTSNGTTGFGILRQHGGVSEIRTLTVTAAAGGTQTANVTLNGVSYNVPLTNAANDTFTAAQIATGNTYGSLWRVDQVANTVVFTSRIASASQTGTYSLSSSGAGTLATGSFVRNIAGVVAINDWTYKNNWNGTPITFDPSKLNIYAIDFRWLGAGIVRFFMEDPITGKMTLVHTNHFANSSTLPHINNPSFRIGYVSAATNPTVDTATVGGASMMASIQGQVEQTTYSKSWAERNSTNKPQNTMHHLMSIRNPYQKAGKTNNQEIIFQDLSVALQCTDPSVVYIFINASTNTPLLFHTIPNSTAMTANNSVTIDPQVNLPASVFTVGINGSSQFDITPFKLTLAPGDTLSVCVLSTAAITSSSVALVWSPE